MAKSLLKKSYRAGRFFVRSFELEKQPKGKTMYKKLLQTTFAIATALLLFATPQTFAAQKKDQKNEST